MFFVRSTTTIRFIHRGSGVLYQKKEACFGSLHLRAYLNFLRRSLTLSHPKSDPPFFRRNKTQITQLLNLIARREKSDGLYRPARKTVAPLGQTDHDLL